ncbi:MAG TPA: hypothetical protein DCF65_00335 [Chloroflexi bacterium]|jgi:hypothetical protein|nr:hypothetical protein [Chloroflexota bacterium]HAF20953.1 hypothetical protein [Chloroflexota bacterium]
MTRYSVDIFLHVTGAIAVFVGYASLLLAVTAARRATRSEQVQAITSTLLATRKIGLERISVIDVIVIAGVLMIAVTGADMALSLQLIRAPWIDVAIGSFILLAPIGPLLINPRLHQISDAADLEPSGPISSRLRMRVRDPLLTVALGGSFGILIGLVFLMTTKPTLSTSLTAIAVAVGAGVTLSWAFVRDSAEPPTKD